jgi:large subunit ribosomal protein L5
MTKPRLEERYLNEIRAKLQKQLGLDNVMSVPRLNKIVLNVGVKDAVSDSKSLQVVEQTLESIAGQKPLRTVARKSIAGFKLREGMPIGATVTLRRRKMYEFLDKLIALALPKVRDFQGVSRKLDQRGNYNLGIKEWIIFPELDFEVAKKPHGMNITFHTTAKNDDHGRALLEEFGMPFKKA